MKRNARIAVVAGILLVIAGIWAVKNTDIGKQTPIAETEPVTETAETVPVDTEALAEVTETAKEEAPTEKADEGPEATDGAVDLALEWTTHDFATLVSYNKPMILDFGAEECGPCQIMAPDLEAFHAEYKEQATIQFYDVWKKPELAANYPVQVVPTQFFFLPDGSPYAPSEAMNDSGIRFTLFMNRETDEHGLTGHTGILNKEQLEMILEDMEKQVE